MKTTRNNDKALAAYIEAQAKVHARLETLRAAIADHQDRRTPEEINYAHVGDLGHVAEVLDEILGFLGVKPTAG